MREEVSTTRKESRQRFVLVRFPSLQVSEGSRASPTLGPRTCDAVSARNCRPDGRVAKKIACPMDLPIGSVRVSGPRRTRGTGPLA
ncbi:hypothetical protein MTO96_013635 [Rhipicephalus appendiculatus]